MFGACGGCCFSCGFFYFILIFFINRKNKLAFFFLGVHESLRRRREEEQRDFAQFRFKVRILDPDLTCGVFFLFFFLLLSLTIAFKTSIFLRVVYLSCLSSAVFPGRVWNFKFNVHLYPALKLPRGFISDRSVAYVKPRAAPRFISQCVFFHGEVDRVVNEEKGKPTEQHKPNPSFFVWPDPGGSCRAGTVRQSSRSARLGHLRAPHIHMVIPWKGFSSSSFTSDGEKDGLILNGLAGSRIPHSSFGWWKEKQPCLLSG